MLIFIGENPNPDYLKSPDYLTTLSAGGQSFLDFAKSKKQEYPILAIALELYESDSKERMWYLCNLILQELQVIVRTQKRSVSCEAFFSICILYMVSRATEIAKQSLLTKDISFVPAPNDGDKVSIPLEVKVQTLLFETTQMVAPLGLFEKIGSITGKKYDKARYGKSLMDFFERCIFIPSSTNVVLGRSIEDLSIRILKNGSHVGKDDFIPYRDAGNYYEKFATMDIN
jgi:hypothetical protein